MRKRFSLFVLLLFLYAVPAFADQGGDDTFGYMWTDSDGPTNIPYNWLDARGGDNLFGPAFNNDTARVTLPFDFVLYGDIVSTAWVSTNGWISFSRPNGPIP
ncbi:MAG: hypothetical protein E4H13_04485, partial [Calditrichales bacterium]